MNKILKRFLSELLTPHILVKIGWERVSMNSKLFLLFAFHFHPSILDALSMDARSWIDEVKRVVDSEVHEVWIIA